MNEAAYKGMVHPVLEYISSVWDPLTNTLQDEIEKIQNRVAKFVTRNYVYDSWSMTGINVNPLRKGERMIDSFCYTKV